MLAGVGVGAILAGVAFVSSRGPAMPAPEPVVFSIDAPDGASFPTSVQSLSITPDGSTIYYTVLSEFAGGSLYEHPLGGGSVGPVPETRDVPMDTGFISADGERLGFMQNSSVGVLSLASGETTEVCAQCSFDAPRTNGEGAAWAGDDAIVFTSRGALMKVPTAGGEPRELIGPGPENTGGGYTMPSSLPGGDWVLATRNFGRALDGASIVAINVETGEEIEVVEDGASPRFAASGGLGGGGHVVFVRDGDFWALPFDPVSRLATGQSRFVRGGVLISADSGQAHLTISDTGTLAYIPGDEYRRLVDIVSVDRANNRETMIEEGPGFNDVRLSPDGTLLAVEALDGRDTDIRIYDVASGAHLRTFGSEGIDEAAPVFSPDSSRVAFASNAGDTSTIRWAATDGNLTDTYGGTDIIATTEARLTPESWSVDGRIAYVAESDGDWDVWTVDIGGRDPMPVAQTSSIERSATFSPDGLWLAYAWESVADGSFGVRVVAAGDGREVATVDAWGTHLQWSVDGFEIFYAGPGLRSIPVLSAPGVEPGFRLGEPARVGPTGLYRHRFGVSPDARTFTFVDDRSWAQPLATKIVVVLNWFEELNRLAPSGR
ncbi:MAG: hypothetical protein PVJ49_00390 [Acidobacteriota bacterium]